MQSFIFIFAVFQVAYIYAHSNENICSAPAITGDAAAKRLHMVDVSKNSTPFLTTVSEIPALCMGNSVYRIEVENPSSNDKVMNAARQAIGETSPKVVEEAKAKLVDLLKKDSSLNVPLDNTDWVVRFLRLRKYDVQAAYELIKEYYNFKAQNKKIYQDLVPSKQNKVAAEGIFNVLPNRDQAGRRIVVATSSNWNPKKFTIHDVLKTGIVLTEGGAYEPATQIAGVQLIFDASGLTMQQIRSLNPATVKKIADFLLKAGPFRIEGIHIVKQPRIFWTLFNLFKPFLTKDIKSKIFFHGNDMKSLHRHIRASNLPDVFGGSYSMPKISSYEWETLLKFFDEEFAKLDSYGLKQK